MKKLPVVSLQPGTRREENLAPQPTATPTRASGEHRSVAYWRSLADRMRPATDKAKTWREFPTDHADVFEIPADGVSRRRFFGLVGSGAALAGITSTGGCLRKPKENILPFSERPEDVVPGVPLFYASAIQLGPTVEGIVVESQDGRPIKIEGNPKHSNSQGGTSAFTQASVLDLYDPDRSRYPVGPGGEPAPLRGEGSALEAVGNLLTEAQANGGATLALVIPLVLSPTERELLEDVKRRFPKVRLFLDDPLVPEAITLTSETIGGKGARTRYVLENTRVVFAADSDFFSLETDAVRLTREWSRTRKLFGPNEEISRLYVVEPHLSTVGVLADHRVRVKGSKVGDVLLALAKALVANDTGGILRSPPGFELAGLPDVEVDETTKAFVNALAKDLLAAAPLAGQEAEAELAGISPREREAALARRTGSAILVGHRQPPWVHALGLALNAALRNGNQSVRWSVDTAAPATEPLSALADALRNSAVTTVIALGTNPAYDGGGALDLPKLLSATTLVHLGRYRDETGVLATWHVPVSHFLEAWGDLEASDGTISIQQPLIDPLHGTLSTTEWLAFLANGREIDGYSLLKGHWTQALGAGYSDSLWRQWLHDGVVTGAPRSTATPSLTGWSQAAAWVKERAPAIDDWEVDFHFDPKVVDGRFGNNAWLQELPHPLTKVVWDNAAMLSVADAAALGVENNDLVRIAVGGVDLELPVFVAPGQADKTVSVALGYGRKILPPHGGGEPATVSHGAGFDVQKLRPLDAPWIVAGRVERAGGSYTLATTQEYGSMKPRTGNDFIDNSSIGDFPERPLVREATLAEFAANPNFVEEGNLIPAENLRHLWDPPKLTGPHQWGMSIDLNRCTGCGVCIIACQAENNIPVVGKAEAGYGREMHWVRVDRYYRGDDENDPTAVFQPVSCQHCESAPCETVCPVAATVHSPEGLNDMAYNRCIGTRYCSNNCPYKVRRFNFFANNTDLRPSKFWNEDVDGAWLRQMQRNPDVTIRFRGVMEKCTYCVQRINHAKIEAHVAGKDLVEDGTIKVACQQACPAECVVFGNIADPDSAVSRSKRSPRDYALLRDLNTHPRTTYLARIRNPHPDLAPKTAPEAHGHTGEAEQGGH